ncbi:MAG: hypothetical protein IKI93_19870, partial [Clostridia bacterium]|nr:hypothetical protein [Clostridia bacterium]
MLIRKLKKYTPTKFMAEDSHYDKSAADFAVAFIESLCHTKGTWARKTFELIDWQEKIIRDIFGTIKPNGYRQFNTAYIEIPKKQGKSELAAAVALLLTCGDGEERAEVYGCAADRQQASIVFNVAADMVRMCPALSKRVKILESQKRLIYIPTGSIYQVLSADVGNKHGFNTHGVVFDELHTQPNRKLFDVMTKGSGDARMQPLYFLITTAGNDTKSICYEIHQKAKDIIEGRKIDHTFYPVIYGADEGDDWTDPEVWKKANPSLGITVGIDKVRDACESAKQNPGEENAFRQLRLNQWVKQAVRWMPMDKWDRCSLWRNKDLATIGLDMLHFAKITEDENGEETYGTPEKLAKAISADLSVELVEAILYADDGIAEIVKEFGNGTLSLGIDDIGSAVASTLTGATIDSNGVVISASEDGGDPVAIGFRAKKANGK